MASGTTVERADHHSPENHRSEAAFEIETGVFKLDPEEDEENYEKATDFNKLEENESQVVEEKVFDVMPGRGDTENSENGVSQLLSEIEMLDAMIERSAVGLLDLQVMKEELEAKDREMEWKMSESMELKRAMEELKRKKSEELLGKKKAVNNGWGKTKWAAVAVAAACVGIVAAVILVGNVKDDKGNKKPNKIKTL